MVWEPCEDFSAEEIRRYRERFLAVVPEVLRGRKLSKLEILEASKPCFTAEEQEKLWKQRNLPMSHQLIGRALYMLEEQKVLAWDNTANNYSLKQ